MTNDEAPARKTRTSAPLAAGTWDVETRTFLKASLQPTPALTDLVAMVKWARENLISPTDGGRVSFVRLAGTLNVVPKTRLTTEFAP